MKSIFRQHTNSSFTSLALETFRHQAEHVPVYHRFIRYLRINPSNITKLEEIPFMPISLFKTTKIIAEGHEAEIIFESSGTTGMERSRHYVSDLSLYEKSFDTGFRDFYGEPSSYCIIALLPSYMERIGSSLIYMCERLIKESGHPDSGFYLYEHEKLLRKLEEFQKSGQKTLLIGVSFALLDFAEKYQSDLSDIIFMETGGMKGRREEILRSELHSVIQKSFNVPSVHSEYGMTELLSQAYSKSKGIFYCPPWMRVMTTDPHDPFQTLKKGKAGTLNIIDLANKNSCSFIATSDLGKSFPDGSFEVSGRMDNSDIRGCNLLVV